MYSRRHKLVEKNADYFLFERSRSREKEYLKIAGSDLASEFDIESHFGLFSRGSICLLQSLKVQSKRFKNVKELSKYLGFEHFDKMVKLPTISTLQKKLDELAIPVELIPVEGISDDYDFLTIQIGDVEPQKLHSEEKIRVIVSDGCEFFHDMTFHVYSIIIGLCTTDPDSATATLGTPFSVFVNMQRKILKILHTISYFPDLEKKIIARYLSIIYDKFTAMFPQNIHAGEHYFMYIKLIDDFFQSKNVQHYGIYWSLYSEFLDEDVDTNSFIKEIVDIIRAIEN